jgi:hypothetical protein
MYFKWFWQVQQINNAQQSMNVDSARYGMKMAAINFNTFTEVEDQSSQIKLYKNQLILNIFWDHFKI